jgi:hypothetical protein
MTDDEQEPTICPREYPWLREGRCWPTHYYDSLNLYGDSVTPGVALDDREDA